MHRLKGQAVLAIFISAALAVVVYWLLSEISDQLLYHFFEKSTYIEQQNHRYLNEFQKFVSDNQIAATDTEQIHQWIDKEKSVYIFMAIYREDEQLFNPLRIDLTRDTEAYHFFYQEILFSDGFASVYLDGFFDVKVYMYMTLTEGLVAILIFVGSFVWFIQRKINYIVKLEQEIKVLETGGLAHAITIQGSDELTSLADGLNQMRLTLLENSLREEAAIQANYDLVVAVAHDLRTPLTALTLYLDLLHKEKYQDEEQLHAYLDKSRSKVAQIKNMSDQLFERFLLSKEKSVQLEPPKQAQYVFEDCLSDMASYLGNHGFNIESHIQWPDAMISVSTEYVSRIIDNISSNIIKYADPSESIELIIENKQGSLLIQISNKIMPYEEKMESTEVGVPNIQIMMTKMNGKCTIQKNEEEYTIQLWFGV